MPDPIPVNRIIIGLGGTGCGIVDSVASYLDSHGRIPENEAFIFIDSHQGDLDKLWQNIKTEQVVMRKKYLPLTPRDIFLNRNPWFPDRIYDDIVAEGVGMRRAVGKAYYNIHKDGIGAIIREAAIILENKTKNREFLIIIVSALGGGTGSGIMPDLSLDIKNWMQNYNTIIFGIGILPSLGAQDGPANRVNAMAALKELHFLLSSIVNPFHMFILVGREASGALIDPTLQETILRFLVDLGFAPGGLTSQDNQGNTPVHQNKWLDLNDLLFYLTGYTHLFSTIGYQYIEFPANKILRLFETEDTIKDFNEKLEDLRKSGFQELVKRWFPTIKELDEKLEDSQAEVGTIIKNLGIRLKSANTIIDKLDNDVQEMEKIQSSFSKKKVEDVRSKLEDVKTKRDNISYRISSDKDGLNTKLKDLESKIKILNEKHKNLREYNEKLIQEITNPSGAIYDKYHKKQIGLNINEINGFRGKEAKLDVTKEKEGLVSYFLDIMKELKRDQEYNTFVNQPFARLTIANSPLLDYHHPKPEIDDEKVRKILSDRGFIQTDPVNNAIIDKESKVGHVISIISTNRSNIEFGKLDFNGVQNVLQNAIAEHAQMFPLYTDLDRFRVNIYNIMIGLHPWAPAFSSQSRLRDLDKLKKIYDSSNERFLHHSLFLGDFQAFHNLTNIDVSNSPPQRAAESVIKFWKDYNLDKKAVWSRVPITIAEIDRNVDKLHDKLSSLQPELELSKTLQKEEDIGSYIQNLITDLDQLARSLSSYENEFKKEKEHLSGLISQIGSDNVADGTKANIKNFLGHVSGNISEVMNKIKEARSLLSNEVPQHLMKIKVSPQVKDDIKNNIEEILSKNPELVRKFQELGTTLNNIKADIDKLDRRL